MPAATKRAKAAKVAAAPPREPVCGLVLPISAIDGCSPDHWLEVRSIVTEAINAITEAKFVVKLVSDADESGVIQKRIVQNLYSSEIVVCDVSGKNPNVMFELGLRLAFDKPTVIIKDDKTDYSFDTAIIEHVPYPRDLRFAKIVEFKKILSEKVAATYRISTTDPSHSTFLKNFGKFQVAALQQTEVPADKLILEILTELQNDVQNIKQRGDVSEGVRRSAIDDRSLLALTRMSAAVKKARKRFKDIPIAELADHQPFIRSVEHDSDAPRYFATKAEFVEAVKAIIGAVPM